MQAKADLHVHSKYSNRPSEWILRRIGAPECFVEPRELYRRARENGMDFVTISDHNTITGALEIADLPNTFVSAELTTYFPGNGCKIHILVHDITEKQFEEANCARENIFDLQQYLRANDILHTVAHPLFAVNDKLTLEYVEKLLLMFERFEVLNGTRHVRSNRITEVLLNKLTPELMSTLADKHDLEPVGSEPHRKLKTGGSDDHSGVYIAAAHTVTPAAETAVDYLHHLRRGAHKQGGASSTSLRLAHSFYHIGYSYYRNRFLGRNAKDESRLLGTLLKQMINSDPNRNSGIKGAVGGLLGKMARRWKTKRLSPLERTLVDELSALFHPVQKPVAGQERRRVRSDEYTFDIACRVTHRVGYHFLQHFTAHLKNASLLESLQTVSSLGPLALSITPYLTAFRTQHKDEELLRQFIERFRISDPLRLPNPRKVWVTDTFSENSAANPVLRDSVSRGVDTGQRPLVLITSLESEISAEGFEVVNFTPVGLFDLPEYKGRRVAFPPFLNILEYLEREQFEEVIISTPGPVGLTALAAARLLGIKSRGILCTDFPALVGDVTEDETLRQLTWRYTVWFYNQCDKVVAGSENYREYLIAGGVSPGKIYRQSSDHEHEMEQTGAETDSRAEDTVKEPVEAGAPLLFEIL